MVGFNNPRGFTHHLYIFSPIWNFCKTIPLWVVLHSPPMAIKLSLSSDSVCTQVDTFSDGLHWRERIFSKHFESYNFPLVGSWSSSLSFILDAFCSLSATLFDVGLSIFHWFWKWTIRCSGAINLSFETPTLEIGDKPFCGQYGIPDIF